MRLTGAVILLFASSAALADVVHVAVASNFRLPAAEIATAFERASGHDIRISSASTGVLYAQIVNGAPFDLLLAADSERPRRLVAEGLGDAATRRTYAVGRLVLWSASPALRGTDCRARLAAPSKHGHIAVANPDTAPYGLAARQFLEREGLWEALHGRLVFGENISQTLQFVATRNAELGFIAASQAADPRLPEATCQWPVPAALHAPIEQQLVALTGKAGKPAVRSLLEFIEGEEAAAILRSFRYGLPE